jgi:predicted ferric reductase
MAFGPWLLAALYLCVTLAPLFIAWLDGSASRYVLDELAAGAGLLAFAIILVEFLLSGRFRWISGKVGLDVTMRLHQLFARLAIVLVVLHPFLYVTPMCQPRPWDTSRQLCLSGDLGAYVTGIAGALILFGLVLAAIARKTSDVSYETWRLVHGVTAVLVAGLVLHHALHAGRYSQEPNLAIFWIALFALALGSLLYVYAVKPFLRLARPWAVRSVKPIGLKSWEVTIDPVGHRGCNYKAGQFVWLRIASSAFSLHENPFSISSAPGFGPALQFVIKEQGDFTGSIGKVPDGARAFIDGPHGNLTAPPSEAKGIALIAGGVGIAPLLSILRQLQFEHDPRQVVLIYGNRVAEQIVYADELDHLAKTGRIKLHLALQEPEPGWEGHVGFIDHELLARACADDTDNSWHYLLCGPNAMMETVEDNLIARGVSPRQIHGERFSYD